jgi:hypothetical protein
MPKCISTSASPAGTISHLPWRSGLPKRVPPIVRPRPPRRSAPSSTSTPSMRLPDARRATRLNPSTSGSSGNGAALAADDCPVAEHHHEDGIVDFTVGGSNGYVPTRRSTLLQIEEDLTLTSMRFGYPILRTETAAEP